MLKGVVGCGWVRCLGRGFAPVGLNGFAPVFFFFEWVCSGVFFLNGFAPVGFKSVVWVSDLWLCWFDGLMAWVFDRRGFVFLIGVVVVEGGRLIRCGFVFVVCARG